MTDDHAPERGAMTLEDRVRRLEDLEQIREVTARYAHATNRGFAGRTIDWDALETVYTEDSEWHSVDMDLHVSGRKSILDVLRKVAPTVDIAMHSFTSPLIDLDGDTATGRWIMPIGSVHGGQLRSVFMDAAFTYQRTAAGWRISRTDVSFALMLVTDAPTAGRVAEPTDTTPGGKA
ncbi:nuclear transport factor 2 family protein [Actinomadura rayongensis]|uniref:SnoaL-like domain-containing protein n=1 Tax=Actinomadura rayongensis TaxID=1429076 RepID=A0A6I4WKW3_9ACTN|nr:nuclear transport factor 2 family protein [Actinomadura rayongensis]MXQ67554.1 hypothetical protein [Actinomadura rayongensis]